MVVLVVLAAAAAAMTLTKACSGEQNPVILRRVFVYDVCVLLGGVGLLLFYVMLNA